MLDSCPSGLRGEGTPQVGRIRVDQGAHAGAKELGENVDTPTHLMGYGPKCPGGSLCKSHIMNQTTLHTHGGHAFKTIWANETI